jgi:triphosphoribosyl-dephospho-CoA synthase
MTISLSLHTEQTADIDDSECSLALPAAYFAHDFAHDLAHLAVQALIDEAMLTPKPGLVDLRGNGAHADLNWPLMCQSAIALEPTFLAMALAARDCAGLPDLQDLRERIGRIGRDGESIMMETTGGVNTHRGAIWALGLLVTAAAQNIHVITPAAIASRAGALARLTDRFAPESTGNKGEIARRKFNVGGARSQAESGFPCVMDGALPVLKLSRSRGDSETESRLNALFAIIARLDDTCVLSRGGAETLRALQQDASDVLASGGAGHVLGRAVMQGLEQNLKAAGASPGGAADLLAATLFLDRVSRAKDTRTHCINKENRLIPLPPFMGAL